MKITSSSYTMAPVLPLPHSTSVPHYFFAKNKIPPWSIPVPISQILNCSHNAGLRSRRFPGFPLLLLPRTFISFPDSLPFRRRLVLPCSPLLPLLRPRFYPFFSPMSALTDNPTSTPTKTVRVVIKGRVQGVFYRNWTEDNARELGLNGWVRNRRDGSVEALFSGIPEKVDEMALRCRRGPPAAVVTGLEVTPSADDPGSRFERKPTV